MSSNSFADEVLFLVPFGGRRVACLGTEDANAVADVEREILTAEDGHGHPTENPTEDFQVPLEGFVVECVSIEDAIVIQKADAILSGRDDSVHTPAELGRIAAVLTSYGRESAADAIKGHASRTAAAASLTESVGG